MRILTDTLGNITAEDIAQICEDQVPEELQVELKQDLPTKDGRPDGWHAGNNFGDYARNQIAEEIVALANTSGGVLLVGITETADHPKRANGIQPLPRVHDLARRLRQAIQAIVEPPLPLLEAIGIETAGVDSGVVLIRVAASRARPHRHQVNREVYIRRADESVRLGMREIHELTIQSFAEGREAESLIERHQNAALSQIHDWNLAQQGQGSSWGAGLHLLAVPTTKIDLGRVVDRQKLRDHRNTTYAQMRDGNPIECAWPYAHHLQWGPAMRAIRAENNVEHRRASYLLQTNGLCEIIFSLRATEERPGFFAGWLLGAMGVMLAFIERMRAEAGGPVEYLMAPQIVVLGGPVALVGYGARNFGQQSAKISIGTHKFPWTSVGPRTEFPMLLGRFDEDLWNLSGEDIQQHPATFEIAIAE